MKTATIAYADIGPFIAALHNPMATEAERIDACHALGKSDSEVSIAALIGALGDESFAVRWAAAEMLLVIGYPTVRPLLRELISNASEFTFKGAYHVLSRLADPETHSLVQPVLKAMHGSGANMAVPVAAAEALHLMEQ